MPYVHYVHVHMNTTPSHEKLSNTPLKSAELWVIDHSPVNYMGIKRIARIKRNPHA